MFPIYGFGVLLEPIGRMVDWWVGAGAKGTVMVKAVGAAGKAEIVEPVESAGMWRLSAKDRLIRHGMLYMVLIFLAEYISGAWLRARGICPWDYSASRANVDGLIRLDFAPLWFATGLLFEQITKKKGR